ncbi:hypothetical protein V495_02079 [Pseudogymnoascus sp. VKM F-4514 (FW-929)]|nr:hypothetical protein V495_02079 [Pseudogymnoascus sp. VKM F-4514 (FW-929)]KFY66398.1 hypothetical protein V497_00941 [Pseudogymnoascus sp. VKM F-4516 (FW-969)]
MAEDTYAQLKTSSVLAGLGQRLVSLSETNKNALLSEATKLTHSLASRTRADAILSQMKVLNLDITRQFKPKQDSLADIRLRMICPSPQSGSPSTVGNVPTYIAVSYCWHYKQWPLAPAAKTLCHGWEISQPMMDAVMALRRPYEGVWLDKLCINQKDDVDKAAHIGVMDIIYHSARQIAILLEDVQLTEDEEEAGLVFAEFYKDLCFHVNNSGLVGEEKMQFIDEYFPSQTEKLRSNNKAHILATVKLFAKKILGARWYGRGWCAHESRISKHQKVNNPLIFCFGSDGKVLSFEFRFIHYLGMYLSNLEPHSLVGNEFMRLLNDPVPKTLPQFWYRIQRLMPDASTNVSPLQHLVSILSFGCVNNGDLLSIALNTAKIPVNFDGQDIQYVEEVIWKFSLLVLASGDLNPIITIGKALRVPTAGGEIISWMVNPAQGVTEDPIPNPLPESITAITQEYIELDLLVFESIPRKASLESEEKATRLITDHNLNAISDTLVFGLPEATLSVIRLVESEITRLEPQSNLIRNFQHRSLSLAIDNGLDWILNFSSAMQQTTTTWSHGILGAHTDPGCTPAAQSLISLLNLDASLHKYLGTPHSVLNRIAQSLTTLLDPRLILLTVNLRNLPLSPALGGAALTQSASNTGYIAVPAALAHLPGWHCRAWVIEPFDPAGKPEQISDLLPPADMRVAKEGEVEEKVEDVMPVLDSDHEDRRVARDDTRATWRVRRRQVLFGSLGSLWGEEGVDLIRSGVDLLKGGEGIVLLKKQRVYGCEDYPWEKIYEVLTRVFRDNTKAPNVTLASVTR